MNDFYRIERSAVGKEGNKSSTEVRLKPDSRDFKVDAAIVSQRRDATYPFASPSSFQPLNMLRIWSRRP